MQLQYTSMYSMPFCNEDKALTMNLYKFKK